MSSKAYKPKDHFFKKAHAEGLRARSAFKIEEIARRFSIFKKGQTVLDLGAAPGGFLQIILAEVGPNGTVVGVDLVPIRSLGKANVKTAVLDVHASDFDQKLLELHPGRFDVVASDLAPKTTGIHTVDEARSLGLAGKALQISQARGKARGHFIAKLFMGGGFEEFRDQIRLVYEEVKIVRPEATRQASKEVYLVGLRRRGS